jgi:hypothetical protein
MQIAVLIMSATFQTLIVIFQDQDHDGRTFAAYSSD